MSFHQRRGPGFTLIELLVVVAVIALLISILLPSLQSAREIARKTYCQTSMRSAGMGVTMYATDNRNYILPVKMAYPNPNDPTQYHSMYWYDLIGPYCDGASKPLDKNIYGENTDFVTIGVQPKNNNYGSFFDSDPTGPPFGYKMQCSRLFDCPSIPNQGDGGQSGGDNWYYMGHCTEFVWNVSFGSTAWTAWADVNWPNWGHAIIGSWGKTANAKKLQDIPSFGNFGIVLDIDHVKAAATGLGGQPSYMINMAYDAARGLNAAAGAPHLNTLNLLYIDGHVQNVTADFVANYFPNRATKGLLPFDTK